MTTQAVRVRQDLYERIKEESRDDETLSETLERVTDLGRRGWTEEEIREIVRDETTEEEGDR